MAIRPREQTAYVSVTVKLPKDLVSDIDLCIEYLGEGNDRTHVMREALREGLASDRGFQQFKRSRPAGSAADGGAA